MTVGYCHPGQGILGLSCFLGPECAGAFFSCVLDGVFPFCFIYTLM